MPSSSKGRKKKKKRRSLAHPLYSTMARGGAPSLGSLSEKGGEKRGCCREKPPLQGRGSGSQGGKKGMRFGTTARHLFQRKRGLAPHRVRYGLQLPDKGGKGGRTSNSHGATWRPCTEEKRGEHKTSPRCCFLPEANIRGVEFCLLLSLNRKKKKKGG